MKYTVIYLFLVFTLKCISQSGTATYKIQIAFDEEAMAVDKKYGLLQNAVEAPEEMEYVLTFKNKESNFYLADDDGLDKVAVNTVSALVGVRNMTYHNLETKEMLHKVNADGLIIKKNEFVIKEVNNLKWKITSETKLIDAYLCYKALTYKTIIKNGKEFQETATSWFCPKLPYAFGPAKYSELPGLILEIQEKNIAFMIKNISFDPEENIIITIPEAKKIISQQEYHTITNERFETLKSMSEKN